MAINQAVLRTEEGFNDVIINPVSFTDQWTDIGYMIRSKDSLSLAFWLDISVNDSTDIRFRPVVYLKESTDDFYLLPTEEIYTGVNKFYPKYYQLQKIEDQRILFQVNTGNMIPFVSIQIYDATSGFSGTRAVINSIKVTQRN